MQCYKPQRDKKYSRILQTAAKTQHTEDSYREHLQDNPGSSEAIKSTDFNVLVVVTWPLTDENGGRANDGGENLTSVTKVFSGRTTSLLRQNHVSPPAEPRIFSRSERVRHRRR